MTNFIAFWPLILMLICSTMSLIASNLSTCTFGWRFLVGFHIFLHVQMKQDARSYGDVVDSLTNPIGCGGRQLVFALPYGCFITFGQICLLICLGKLFIEQNSILFDPNSFLGVFCTTGFCLSNVNDVF